LLNFLSILSFDSTNARNYHAGPDALRWRCNYYRSPATIIDRPPLLSITPNYSERTTY